MIAPESRELVPVMDENAGNQPLTARDRVLRYACTALDLVHRVPEAPGDLMLDRWTTS